MGQYVSMLAAGWHNLPLTKYLVQQVTQSDENRLNALKEYYPHSKNGRLEPPLQEQRVQVIKKR